MICEIYYNGTWLSSLVMSKSILETSMYKQKKLFRRWLMPNIKLIEDQIHACNLKSPAERDFLYHWYQLLINSQIYARNLKALSERNLPSSSRAKQAKKKVCFEDFLRSQRRLVPVLYYVIHFLIFFPDRNLYWDKAEIW